MMKLLSIFGITAALVAGSFAGAAAQERYPGSYPERNPEAAPDRYGDYDYDDDDDDDAMMNISLGGGAIGFTDEALRDSTDVGGNWNVRFGLDRVVSIMDALGIGGEVSYQGSAQNVDTLGVVDGTLLSNGIEGAVRFAILTPVVQPYIFGGVAWRRYDLRSDANTSNMHSEDDVLEIPAGGGLSFNIDNVVLDGRFTFRGAFRDELLPGQELHTWAASANAGVRF